MRTVQSDSNGLPQVWLIPCASLVFGGSGGLTATFTSTVPHRLVTGDIVRIKVATSDPEQYTSYFNSGSNSLGVYVTVTSSTVFTYLMLASPGANATAATVLCQQLINSDSYDPFALISQDGYLFTAPIGIAVIENETLVAGTGAVQAATANLSAALAASTYFTKAWVYGISGFTGGVPTFNTNVMYSGKSATSLPDQIAAASVAPVEYLMPAGQKMLLSAIHVKPANGDGAFIQWT